MDIDLADFFPKLYPNNLSTSSFTSSTFFSPFSNSIPSSTYPLPSKSYAFNYDRLYRMINIQPQKVKISPYEKENLNTLSLDILLKFFFYHFLNYNNLTELNKLALYNLLKFILKYHIKKTNKFLNCSMHFEEENFYLVTYQFLSSFFIKTYYSISLIRNFKLFLHNYNNNRNLIGNSIQQIHFHYSNFLSALSVGKLSEIKYYLPTLNNYTINLLDNWTILHFLCVHRFLYSSNQVTGQDLKDEDKPLDSDPLLFPSPLVPSSSTSEKTVKLTSGSILEQVIALIMDNNSTLIIEKDKRLRNPLHIACLTLNYSLLLLLLPYSKIAKNFQDSYNYYPFELFLISFLRSNETSSLNTSPISKQSTNYPLSSNFISNNNLLLLIKGLIPKNNINILWKFFPLSSLNDPEIDTLQKKKLFLNNKQNFGLNILLKKCNSMVFSNLFNQLFFSLNFNFLFYLKFKELLVTCIQNKLKNKIFLDLVTHLHQLIQKKINFHIKKAQNIHLNSKNFDEDIIDEIFESEYKMYTFLPYDLNLEEWINEIYRLNNEILSLGIIYENHEAVIIFLDSFSSLNSLVLGYFEEDNSDFFNPTNEVKDRLETNPNLTNDNCKTSILNPKILKFFSNNWINISTFYYLLIYKNELILFDQILKMIPLKFSLYTILGYNHQSFFELNSLKRNDSLYEKNLNDRDDSIFSCIKKIQEFEVYHCKNRESLYYRNLYNLNSDDSDYYFSSKLLVDFLNKSHTENVSNVKDSIVDTFYYNSYKFYCLYPSSYFNILLELKSFSLLSFASILNSSHFIEIILKKFTLFTEVPSSSDDIKKNEEKNIYDSFQNFFIYESTDSLIKKNNYFIYDSILYTILLANSKNLIIFRDYFGKKNFMKFCNNRVYSILCLKKLPENSIIMSTLDNEYESILSIYFTLLKISNFYYNQNFEFFPISKSNSINSSYSNFLTSCKNFEFFMKILIKKLVGYFSFDITIFYLISETLNKCDTSLYFYNEVDINNILDQNSLFSLKDTNSHLDHNIILNKSNRKVLKLNNKINNVLNSNNNNYYLKKLLLLKYMMVKKKLLFNLNISSFSTNFYSNFLKFLLKIKNVSTIYNKRDYFYIQLNEHNSSSTSYNLTSSPSSSLDYFTSIYLVYKDRIVNYNFAMETYLLKSDQLAILKKIPLKSSTKNTIFAKMRTLNYFFELISIQINTINEDSSDLSMKFPDFITSQSNLSSHKSSILSTFMINFNNKHHIKKFFSFYINSDVSFYSNFPIELVEEIVSFNISKFTERDSNNGKKENQGLFSHLSIDNDVNIVAKWMDEVISLIFFDIFIYKIQFFNNQSSILKLIPTLNNDFNFYKNLFLQYLTINSNNVLKNLKFTGLKFYETLNLIKIKNNLKIKLVIENCQFSRESQLSDFDETSFSQDDFLKSLTLSSSPLSSYFQINTVTIFDLFQYSSLNISKLFMLVNKLSNIKKVLFNFNQKRLNSTKISESYNLDDLFAKNIPSAIDQSSIQPNSNQQTSKFYYIQKKFFMTNQEKLQKKISFIKNYIKIFFYLLKLNKSFNTKNLYKNLFYFSINNLFLVNNEILNRILSKVSLKNLYNNIEQDINDELLNEDSEINNYFSTVFDNNTLDSPINLDSDYYNNLLQSSFDHSKTTELFQPSYLFMSCNILKKDNTYKEILHENILRYIFPSLYTYEYLTENDVSETSKELSEAVVSNLNKVLSVNIIETEVHTITPLHYIFYYNINIINNSPVSEYIKNFNKIFSSFYYNFKELKEVVSQFNSYQLFNNFFSHYLTHYSPNFGLIFYNNFLTNSLVYDENNFDNKIFNQSNSFLKSHIQSQSSNNNYIHLKDRFFKQNFNLGDSTSKMPEMSITYPLNHTNNSNINSNNKLLYNYEIFLKFEKILYFLYLKIENKCSQILYKDITFNDLLPVHLSNYKISYVLKSSSHNKYIPMVHMLDGSVVKFDNVVKNYYNLLRSIPIDYKTYLGVDTLGLTLLHSACILNDRDLILYLFKTNPKKWLNIFHNHFDSNGKTPKIYLINNNNCELVEHILKVYDKNYSIDSFSNHNNLESKDKLEDDEMIIWNSLEYLILVKLKNKLKENDIFQSKNSSSESFSVLKNNLIFKKYFYTTYNYSIKNLIKYNSNFFNNPLKILLNYLEYSKYLWKLIIKQNFFFFIHCSLSSYYSKFDSIIRARQILTLLNIPYSYFINKTNNKTSNDSNSLNQNDVSSEEKITNLDNFFLFDPDSLHSKLSLTVIKQLNSIVSGWLRLRIKGKATSLEDSFIFFHCPDISCVLLGQSDLYLNDFNQLDYEVRNESENYSRNIHKILNFELNSVSISNSSNLSASYISIKSYLLTLFGESITSPQTSLGSTYKGLEIPSYTPSSTISSPSLTNQIYKQDQIKKLLGVLDLSYLIIEFARMLCLSMVQSLTTFVPTLPIPSSNTNYSLILKKYNSNNLILNENYRNHPLHKYYEEIRKYKDIYNQVLKNLKDKDQLIEHKSFFSTESMSNTLTSVSHISNTTSSPYVITLSSNPISLYPLISSSGMFSTISIINLISVEELKKFTRISSSFSSRFLLLRTFLVNCLVSFFTSINRKDLALIFDNKITPNKEKFIEHNMTPIDSNKNSYNLNETSKKLLESNDKLFQDALKILKSQRIIDIWNLTPSNFSESTKTNNFSLFYTNLTKELDILKENDIGIKMIEVLQTGRIIKISKEEKDKICEVFTLLEKSNKKSNKIQESQSEGIITFSSMNFSNLSISRRDSLIFESIQSLSQAFKTSSELFWLFNSFHGILNHSLNKKNNFITEDSISTISMNLSNYYHYFPFYVFNCSSFFDQDINSSTNWDKIQCNLNYSIYSVNLLDETRRNKKVLLKDEEENEASLTQIIKENSEFIKSENYQNIIPSKKMMKASLSLVENKKKLVKDNFLKYYFNNNLLFLTEDLSYNFIVTAALLGDFDSLTYLLKLLKEKIYLNAKVNLNQEYKGDIIDNKIDPEDIFKKFIQSHSLYQNLIWHVLFMIPSLITLSISMKKFNKIYSLLKQDIPNYNENYFLFKMKNTSEILKNMRIIQDCYIKTLRVLMSNYFLPTTPFNNLSCFSLGCLKILNSDFLLELLEYSLIQNYDSFLSICSLDKSLSYNDLEEKQQTTPMNDFTLGLSIISLSEFIKSDYQIENNYSSLIKRIYEIYESQTINSKPLYSDNSPPTSFSSFTFNTSRNLLSFIDADIFLYHSNFFFGSITNKNYNKDIFIIKNFFTNYSELEFWLTVDLLFEKVEKDIIDLSPLLLSIHILRKNKYLVKRKIKLYLNQYNYYLTDDYTNDFSDDELDEGNNEDSLLLGNNYISYSQNKYQNLVINKDLIKCTDCNLLDFIILSNNLGDIFSYFYTKFFSGNNFTNEIISLAINYYENKEVHILSTNSCNRLYFRENSNEIYSQKYFENDNNFNIVDYNKQFKLYQFIRNTLLYLHLNPSNLNSFTKFYSSFGITYNSTFTSDCISHLIPQNIKLSEILWNIIFTIRYTKENYQLIKQSFNNQYEKKNFFIYFTASKKLNFYDLFMEKIKMRFLEFLCESIKSGSFTEDQMLYFFEFFFDSTSFFYSSSNPSYLETLEYYWINLQEEIKKSFGFTISLFHILAQRNWSKLFLFSLNIIINSRLPQFYLGNNKVESNSLSPHLFLKLSHSTFTSIYLQQLLFTTFDSSNQSVLDTSVAFGSKKITCLISDYLPLYYKKSIHKIIFVFRNFYLLNENQEKLKNYRKEHRNPDNSRELNDSQDYDDRSYNEDDY